MKNEKYQNESCMEIVPVEIQKKADGSQDETFQEGKKTKDEEYEIISTIGTTKLFYGGPIIDKNGRIVGRVTPEETKQYF